MSSHMNHLLAVSASFARRGRRRYVGLLAGLRPGSNVVRARLGRRGARLTIVNHPGARSAS
jgi:hypothetical protein